MVDKKRTPQFAESSFYHSLVNNTDEGTASGVYMSIISVDVLVC